MPDSGDMPDPPPPRESIGPRPCRRCGYDLEAQKPRDGIITCPECGLAGPWAEVMRHEGNEVRWGQLVLTTSGPCIALLALALMVSILGDAIRESWPHRLSIVIGFVGLFAGLAVPPVVAVAAAGRGLNTAAKFRIFAGGLAAGWGTNTVVVLALYTILSLLY